MVGPLRARLRRARGRRRSSTGRRPATATSSCSRPRACPRCRSTGTRCWRRCSAWVGAGLLAYRLADLVLARGRAAAGARAAAARRRARRRPSPRRWAASGGCSPRAVALVALTGAFAGSTAVFNSTYQQQAEVDARLTNGADVTVTESPGAQRRARGAPRGSRRSRASQRRAAPAPLRLRRRRPPGPLRRAPGDDRRRRQAAGRAGSHGGSAAGLMGAARASARLGVLVSAETVQRLPAAPGRPAPAAAPGRPHASSFTTVPFHYAGVAKEFPTAPTDSFLVANAAYVARATGSDAVGAFLVQTDGTEPGAPWRRAVRAAVGRPAQVTDIAAPAQGRRLEPDRRRALGADQGRARLRARARRRPPPGSRSALGFRERRRTFALATALGATAAPARRLRLGRVRCSSTAGGLGARRRGRRGDLACMLVKVLTGVFDPPPDALAVPWAYLGGRAWRSRSPPSAPRAPRRCARCAGPRSRSCASCETGRPLRSPR